MFYKNYFLQNVALDTKIISKINCQIIFGSLGAIRFHKWSIISSEEVVGQQYFESNNILSLNCIFLCFSTLAFSILASKLIFVFTKYVFFSIFSFQYINNSILLYTFFGTLFKSRAPRSSEISALPMLAPVQTHIL